jgi:patatin-like phospholipase/acyl hydrolase
MRILTIDGGGIRGIVPAVVLAELERRAGLPAAELFDLIVGSSTGGILALGLAAPAGTDSRYSADELVELYEREGPIIFSQPLLHRIRAAGNLLGPKYPSGPIEEVLGRYLGDVRLRDSRTRVVVSAYEIELRAPFLFRSARAVDDPSYDWDMDAVARAASAAPTYFSPARLTAAATDARDAYALIDGGVYANNPTMIAYAEARTAAPVDEELTIVSLGTGELTRPIPYRQAQGWGLVRWARPLLDVVFDGVSDTVDYEVRRLTEDAQTRMRRYWRLQPILPMDSGPIDDASVTNIEELETLARRFVSDHTRDLDAVLEAVT